MRPARAVLIAARLVSLLLLAAPVLAAPLLAGPVLAAQAEPGLAECFSGADPEEVMAKGPPTCTIDAEGNMTRTYPGDRPAPGRMSSAGLLVLLALAWSGIPPFLAYQVAKGNGQDVGIAILLGLLLGWLGLLVVYLMGRSDTRAGAHRALAELGPRSPVPPPLPPPPPLRPPADPLVHRLARLDALRSAGTITDQEYAARRTAILDSI